MPINEHITCVNMRMRHVTVTFYVRFEELGKRIVECLRYS